MAAHQASPSLGFSRQEHWSGLPFPPPMHESEKWKWSRSVVSDSSDPMDCSLPGSSIHGIFQAKVLEWVAIAFSIIVLYHFVLYNVLCGEWRFHHLIKISSNPHPQFFHILSRFKHLLKFSTGSGREVRERGGMCIPTADSHWSMAKANAKLESNNLPIKALKKFN